MPALGPHPGVDYEQMVRDLMQVLSTGESLRGDQPYTSKDPGTKYRSGEVESDVGLLDPVDALAGMLASKGTTLVRRAGRALTEPGPRLRPMLRSQRGSTGGSWWDEADDDIPFPGDYEPTPSPPPIPSRGTGSQPGGEVDDAIVLSKRQIAAVMDELVDRHGEYNPDLHGPMYDALEQLPDETLVDYVHRLLQLGERYNVHEFYDPGEFPSPTLQALARTLGDSPAMQKAAQRQRLWHAEEQRVNPYEPGEGPLKRTVDMNAPETEPPSRAQEYAAIIRKLFEQGGR